MLIYLYLVQLKKQIIKLKIEGLINPSIFLFNLINYDLFKASTGGNDDALIAG